MSETNLFEKLESVRTLRRKVMFQPGAVVEDFDPHSSSIVRKTVPMVGVDPIVFEITSITANEALEAEAFVTAMPPEITQEQPSPTRVGTVMARVGWDEEHPEYLAELRKQRPMKDAAICLLGCPALRESTPGNSLREKAETLKNRIPGALLAWLADEVNTLAALTATGEDEVAAFLARGSTATDGSDSGDSSGGSRTGGNSGRKTSRTGRTSTTKSGKRRASGAKTPKSSGRGRSGSKSK